MDDRSHRVSYGKRSSLYALKEDRQGVRAGATIEHRERTSGRRARRSEGLRSRVRLSCVSLVENRVVAAVPSHSRITLMIDGRSIFGVPVNQSPPKTGRFLLFMPRLLAHSWLRILPDKFLNQPRYCKLGHQIDH